MTSLKESLEKDYLETLTFLREKEKNFRDNGAGNLILSLTYSIMEFLKKELGVISENDVPFAPN